MVTPEMMRKMKMLKDKMMSMNNPDLKEHSDYLDSMMSTCEGGCGGEADLTVTVEKQVDEGNMGNGPLMQKFDDAVDMLEHSEKKMIMHMKEMWGMLSPEGQKVAQLLWKIYAMGPEKNMDLNKKMSDYESSM